MCIGLFFFSDHCIKQIDSMLPWVCSVIYHRGRQNVLKTSVTHSRAVREPLLCFFPHFDVICDLLLNRRTAIWNLFVKYKFFLTVKQSSFRERNLASPYRTLCLVPKVYLELWGIYHKSSNRPLPFSKVLEIDKPPPPPSGGGWYRIYANKTTAASQKTFK